MGAAFVVSYPRIAVLGDSLTMGCYASECVNSFPRLVVHSVRGRGNGNAASVLVHGVGGIQTGSWDGGMLANLQALALTPQADLLIIELGTDDFANNVPLAQFSADYAALLAYLVTPARQPLALVCCTPWEVATTANNLGVMAGSYGAAIGAAVAALAAQYPGLAAHVVDLAPLAANPDYHGVNTCPDTFHPGDVGHNAIAQAILVVV